MSLIVCGSVDYYLLHMSVIDLKALLGGAMKAQRASLGISQEELAYRAGLHRTYISDLERGARNPSLESVEKLAQALEVSVAFLLSNIYVEILLVEDNTHDVELTKRAFAKAGISNPLHVVADGEAALQFLFASGAYSHRAGLQHPQLVLLDLRLPKRDGIQVLRQMKADERTRDIPVVVLTSSTRDRDIAECRRLGVDNYIVKPIGLENFNEVTRRIGLRWALLER